jgi:hypothetical protein
MQPLPAPHSLRLVALTGALKIGLAGKGEEGHSRENSEPPKGGSRA